MSELAIAISVGIAAAGGLYLAMSRDVVSIVLGLALFGSAANLFVFAAGRIQRAQPPIVPINSVSPAVLVADPLPQALVLTAIVIGFALTCFGIALCLALQGRLEQNDADRLEVAEPPPNSRGDPGELT